MISDTTRINDIQKEELFQITKADIQMLGEGEKKERKSGVARKELDEMVGLDSVKTVIHKAIAKHKINKLCMEKRKAIELARGRGDDIPDELCYLDGVYLKDYLHDIEICQNFAKRNRVKISEIIYSMTGIPGGMAFHTIHNYIDTKEMVLRKGAIAAHEGEKVLIPINMRDGSILAVGKGNPEWNYSAPHGAGRIMSRRKAKKDLKLDDYIKAMEGIYTTWRRQQGIRSSVETITGLLK